MLRFDTQTKAFEDLTGALPGTFDGARALRGLQIDREGYAWIAANEPCGVVQVDVARRELVLDDIDLPGCQTPVGVSIDRDGRVWLPDKDANQAYRLDPMSLSTTVTAGLQNPYTYSDMTGAGLRLVVNPPEK